MPLTQEQRIQSRERYAKLSPEQLVRRRVSQLRGQGVEISPEQLASLRTAQDYKCAICGVSEQEYGKALAVDHCHETNAVRGLLCTSCNAALGTLGDNVEGVNNALAYLTSPPARDILKV